jgi:hypothetical protein
MELILSHFKDTKNKVINKKLITIIPNIIQILYPSFDLFWVAGAGFV